MKFTPVPTFIEAEIYGTKQMQEIVSDWLGLKKASFTVIDKYEVTHCCCCGTFLNVVVTNNYINE